MDWMASGNDRIEATAPDGARWVIGPSKTTASGAALYRLPPGFVLPEEPGDEDYACAVLRSQAEAKVMAALLDGSVPLSRSLPESFVPSHEHDGRKSWRLPQVDGYLSIHRGSDEDLRDVIVTRFTRNAPGIIHLVAVVSHGRHVSMPERAQPIPAVAMLLALLDAAHRFDRPLDDEDYRLWSSGLPVEQGSEPRDAPEPPTLAILRAAIELDKSGLTSDALHEEAIAIIDEVARETLTPEKVETLRRSVDTGTGAQYMLVATVRGREAADAMVEAARTPRP